jgi:uncharacterized protein
MDKLVHFEIPVDDLDAAKKFYSIFGWNLQDWPMSDGSTYVGIHTTPIDEKTRKPLEPGTINGGMMLKSDKVTAPVFAIHVESIDTRVQQLTAAGATVITPKMDMMGMGFLAYLKDPFGNVISIWEDPPKK